MSARRRPFGFVIIMLLALHAYIGVRLLPYLDGGVATWILGGAVLLLSLILMPLGMMSRNFEDHALADRVSWAGMLAMGWFSSLLVFTFVRDVVLLVLALLPGPITPAVLHDSAVFVPALALLISVIGFFNARRTASVVSVDIPVANLPAELQGFTIAQISDIHVGPTIKNNYLSAIVAAVNALDADVVAITGDLVDGSVAQLSPHTAPLADLKARYGSYFVTGNHEYYSGAAAWVAELRRLGVRVLMNEHVVLNGGAAPLVLAGVTDFGAGHFDPANASDPVRALLNAPADAAVRILLAHQPRSAPAAEQAGFDVQLSGHTHGGQFWPWGHFVRFQQPFTAGLHRLGKLWVYTSRGTGYWGPPKRFGAPSEITRLRLVRA
ncbi:metallophosphoesterase [Amantichitinum ursilacus]|nr:metallophosphoesterase [Amantichitinum ursilacus]